MKRLIAGIMSVILLFSLAACDTRPAGPATEPATESVVQPTDGKRDSLSLFREELPDVVMAVADFGFPELTEEFGIMEHLREEYPNWLTEHDFIMDIPEDRIIQIGDYSDWGELLCFVPKDPNAIIVSIPSSMLRNIPLKNCVQKKSTAAKTAGPS